MKFNHLNVPDQWENYWTRFPEGYTILEALINWVSQVDDMIDHHNQLDTTVTNYGERLDDFINQFEGHLSDEVKDTLSEWQQSGFLDVVINEALDTKYHEMDNRLTTQLTQTVSNMKSRSIYPTEEPYNAVGDGVSNDTEAIRQAYADCKENDTIILKSNNGFLIDDTLLFDKGVNVQLEAPLIFDSDEHKPAIIIDGSIGSARKLHHIIRVVRKSRTLWQNKNDIGVLLINQFANFIDIMQAENFTRAIKCVGDVQGFSHNQFRLNDVVNNLEHIVLDAINKGYVNENIFIGGRFTNFGANLPDNDFRENRRSIIITSSDESYLLNNNNVFLKPTFQNSGGIGVDIEHGTMNRIIAARSELGEGAYFGKVENSSSNNEFDILYSTTGDSERFINNSDNSSNIIKLGRYADRTEAKRQLDSKGNLVDELFLASSNTGVVTSDTLSFINLRGSSTGNVVTSNPIENVSLQESYINLTGAAIGYSIDTTEVKRFLLLVSALEDSDHQVHIVPKDINGNVLSGDGLVKGSRRAGEQFNVLQYGAYRTTSPSKSVSFEVSEEVKSIWIGVGRSLSGVAKIKGFQLLTSDVGFTAIKKL